MTRPIPHINYVPLLPLTKELYLELFAVYDRAKSHTCVFKVEGFEDSETIWTETKEDHQWIIDNILPYYNLTIDDVEELVYTKEDQYTKEAKGRYDSDRTQWEFKNVPPWGPRSLNFTRVGVTSFIGKHKDIEGGCKINIPVLNIRSANIHFIDSNEIYFYPTPALLNVRLFHNVDRIDRVSEYDPPVRVFFQIVLKKSFEYWKELLPLPYGY